MFLRVVAVHMHLAHVRMAQLGQLEINDHQTSQPPVKKEQIHTKPTIADAQPTLASDECKVAAQLEQEVFQPMD